MVAQSVVRDGGKEEELSHVHLYMVSLLSTPHTCLALPTDTCFREPGICIHWLVSRFMRKVKPSLFTPHSVPSLPHEMYFMRSSPITCQFFPSQCMMLDPICVCVCM